jgi:hypothetical protein
LHHKRCPNYKPPPTSFEDVLALNRGIAEREEQRMRKHEDKLVWKRGFLNHKPETEPKPPIPARAGTCTYEDICLTLNKYGVHIYTKNDVYINYFDPSDFAPTAYKLQHTNSVFLYQVSFPPKSDDIMFCYDILNIRLFPSRLKEPLLIMVYFDSDKHCNKLFTPYINVLADFVYCNKLKNHKRCNICQQKKKCFRVCHRCNDKYCVECFHNLHSETMKPCPYCRYSFKDHINAMFKLMIPNPNL